MLQDEMDIGYADGLRSIDEVKANSGRANMGKFLKQLHKLAEIEQGRELPPPPEHLLQ